MRILHGTCYQAARSMARGLGHIGVIVISCDGRISHENIIAESIASAKLLYRLLLGSPPS